MNRSRLVLIVLLVVQLAPFAASADPRPGDVDAAFVDTPPAAFRGGMYQRTFEISNLLADRVTVLVGTNVSSQQLFLTTDVWSVELAGSESRLANVSAYVGRDVELGPHDAYIFITDPAGVRLATLSWTINVEPEEQVTFTPPTSSPTPHTLSTPLLRVERSYGGAMIGDELQWRIHARHEFADTADVVLSFATTPGLELRESSLSFPAVAPGETRTGIISMKAVASGSQQVNIAAIREGGGGIYASIDEWIEVFENQPTPTTVAHPTPTPRPSGFRVAAHDPVVIVEDGRGAFSFTLESGLSIEQIVVADAALSATRRAVGTATVELAPFSRSSSTLELEDIDLPPGRHSLEIKFYVEGSTDAAQLYTVPLSVQATITPVEVAAPHLQISPGWMLEAGRELSMDVRFSNPDRSTAARVSLPRGPWRTGDGVILEWAETDFELGAGHSKMVMLHVRAESSATDGRPLKFNVRTITAEGERDDVRTVDLRIVAAPAPGDAGLAAYVAEHPVAIAVGALSLASLVGALPLLRREWMRYLLMVPAVGLYTRLAKTQVLDHKTRERIHEMIRESPGIHYSAIKEATGLNAGALVHHLRTLERHGLVVSRREGVLRRFFPVGERLPAPPAVPLTPTQQRILEMLEQEPMSQKALALRLGLSQQGVSYHVKTLERKGVLVVEREGNEWKCHRVTAFEVEPASAS